ncbi:GNAT family N-acetyltransferase [Streptomyces longwoodensis]|uniref:GNAT family N-acetyltransferase n=1 Tax=Streptomyces longwoodensis TaxID=68231 RepID=UPI0036F7B541
MHTRTELIAYLDAVDGDVLWVSHIGVEPRYRRLGHATRLLHAVLTHARCGPVALTAAPFPSWREQGLQHEDLRTWYARHGFAPAPSRQDPYRMIRPAVQPAAARHGCGCGKEVSLRESLRPAVPRRRRARCRRGGVCGRPSAVSVASHVAPP